MLKKIVIAFASIVLIIGLVFVALGLFLPNEVVVNNEVEINASPEKVWQVVDDKEKYAEWGPNLIKIEIINDKKWKEFIKGNDEPIVFEAVNIQKPDKYEVKYSMGNIMNGEWRGDFNKTEKGTLLKTEDKIIHTSWGGKIFMPLFFDLDKFAKQFNQRLKQRAESL